MRKRAPIDIVGPIDCQNIPGAGRHMHEDSRWHPQPGKSLWSSITKSGLGTF